MQNCLGSTAAQFYIFADWYSILLPMRNRMSHDRESCSCGSMSHKDSECPDKCEHCLVGGGKHSLGCFVLLRDKKIKKTDQVNHPKHYNSHPSGIECIDVIRHMTFNVGNAVKYCWRAGLKLSDGDLLPLEENAKQSKIQDLKKAIWYLQDEVAMLEGKKDPEALVQYVDIDANERCHAKGTRACGELRAHPTNAIGRACVHSNCSIRRK